ncbi:RNA-binding protein [Streptococcus halichoeri]|uniref:YlmH family RNA-binding protein n=1 Tax=Streptococcus halichoeri TaxID=254785 RepID=UPI0013593CF3|nr:RNA-binding protein [Streptococcus halichoeri]
MIKDSTIYQHFHPDEYAFIDKVKDIIQQVDQTYAWQVTDFVNPRELTIIQSLVAQAQLTCFTSSDLFLSEYQRVIIAPEYYVLDPEDFDMALIEMTYNAKFNQIRHCQVLGTLLNELGIKRSLIGDILITDGNIQVMVAQTLVDYLLGTISKIGRASVQLKQVPLSELKQVKDLSEKETDLLTSSLRLDRLMASVLKMSRHQAIRLIESEKVKVNYRPQTKSALTLAEGDLVSVRGFGRFRFIRLNGLTKHGKYKVTLGKTLHK